MTDETLKLEADRQAVQDAGRGLRRTLLIILAILAIFLLYAFAVERTDISLEKPLDPVRQANVLRVLRLLANPDIVSVDDATGQVALSETTVITVNRIIETIFMALIASAVGTALAVPVSFLAARNLMEDVTAPLASIMAGIIALPIGGWVGYQVGKILHDLAAVTADNAWIGLVALLVVVALFWLVPRIGPPMVTERRPTRREQVFFTTRLVVILVLLVFGLALIGELGLVTGAWLDANLGFLGFLGNFVYVLADLIVLLLPALVALLAGLVAASYGSRYGQEAVLRMSGVPARVLTAVLSAAGSAIVVYAFGSFLNWLYLFDNPENWTIIPAGVAAAVGAVVGLTVTPKRPFPIGFSIYTISRGILNILRSIEPLIMGIVFVVWVSLGPFAGIMALTLHSIAALGKLFSEQVEGISEGPVEAVTATGANRLQTIIFAVIPQIIPPFTAFALYRWDINVRMSTIIGFVGGGGIGFVLSQNIQQLRYRQASTMMLAIAIVVMVLDYASAKFRSRII